MTQTICMRNKRACSAEIRDKTSVLGGILLHVVKKAYQVIPQVFFNSFSNLIDTESHPRCWKYAKGIVMRKPAKLDQSQLIVIT